MEKNILSLIPTGHENAIPRARLAAVLGVSDRRCRRLVQEARDAGAIILNRQDGRGYYLATAADVEDLQRQYRQDTSRAMAILKRRKTIRGILKECGVSV
jgi:biotin operon repressor